MSIERLEGMLRSHDWYYQYSDDHRVWTAGNRAHDALHRELLNVPPAEARKLWEKYAPKDYAFPQAYIERFTVEPTPKYAVGQVLQHEVYNSLMLRPVPVAVRLSEPRVTRSERDGWQVRWQVEITAVPLGQNGKPVTGHVQVGQTLVVEEWALTST